VSRFVVCARLIYMPGGKRTDRISDKDLEVLEFIARFGMVPRSAVASWAGTGRSVTLARERRLREAGLVRVWPRYGSKGPFIYATRLGLRAAGRGDLRPVSASPVSVGHDAVVAELAARIEFDGGRVLSEREMLARERASGERSFSTPLSGGRFHRADFVMLAEDGSPGDAVEVELTAKGAGRLDELLRSWRRAVVERKVSGVVYRCPPATRSYVERAVKRTQTERAVRIEDL
jgi:hypothetical protein